MHAFVVRYVVIVVQTSLYAAQAKFIKLCFARLHKMTPIRANTIPAEGIPDAFRSSGKTREFFEQIFGSLLLRASRQYVVLASWTLWWINIGPKHFEFGILILGPKIFRVRIWVLGPRTFRVRNRDLGPKTFRVRNWVFGPKIFRVRNRDFGNPKHFGLARTISVSQSCRA